MKLGEIVYVKGTGGMVGKIDHMEEWCVNHHKGDYDTRYFVLFKGQKQRSGPFLRDHLTEASVVDQLAYAAEG